MAANLGTKRQCPKCGAKFYDLGAKGKITCPKCKYAWEEGKEKKGKKAAAPVAVKKKPSAKKAALAPLPGELPDDLPEIEDGEEVQELDPIEDSDAELVPLDEVQEHEEEPEADPNSDDAEDEMFTELSDGEKLVDDLEDYIETDEDLEDDEEE